MKEQWGYWSVRTTECKSQTSDPLGNIAAPAVMGQRKLSLKTKSEYKTNATWSAKYEFSWQDLQENLFWTSQLNTHWKCRQWLNCIAVQGEKHGYKSVMKVLHWIEFGEYPQNPELKNLYNTLKCCKFEHVLPRLAAFEITFLKVKSEIQDQSGNVSSL